MRIAYVTTYDSSDPRQWSGLGLGIRRALEAPDVEVHAIGPVRLPAPAAIQGYVKSAGYRLMGRNLHRSRERGASRALARAIGNVLGESTADVIFSPGTLPLACVRDDRPVAFWTDSTFAQLVGFYPYFSRLARETLEHGEELERRALERAQLAIYSSDWAAASAIAEYGVPRDRVHVVPFGSHLSGLADEATAEGVVTRRGGDRCTLLFVGRDWERKGGPVAVEVLQRLRAAGVPAELLVVGPAANRVRPTAGLRLLGPLDPAEPAAAERLAALYRASHFLLLPTAADCTPVAIGEAAAFATPTVASDVGGLRTSVLHGRTGWLLPATATADAYVDVIQQAWSDVESYRVCALASYRDYRERLNWNVAGRTVRSLLREVACSIA